MQPRQSERRPTFAITTLGCKVNQADSEAISDHMQAAGFVQHDASDRADVYIVNTCTVTHLGDRSSRQLIAQAQRRHPDGLLVVTGCYAEMNPKGVAALPGVDLVVGNSDKEHLATRIEQHLQAAPPSQQGHAGESGEERSSAGGHRGLPLFSLAAQHVGSDSPLGSDSVEPEPQPDSFSAASSDARSASEGIGSIVSRTRAQIKVQDGCDNRCTYCIVPSVRGKSRSRSIASIVEHVRRKACAGFQEIVLTGIHLGDYHPSENEKHDLGDLIKALLRETEIPRIRVSSLEPEDFRLEWLALWENPRMCRHFHLPLQSGSDAILRRMARRYDSARYATIVTTAKQLIPGVAISTDIITGFPGETDEDFEQTYQIAKELAFAKTHVFRFSARQGTAAARMKGQIQEEIKKARSQRLLALNEEQSRRFRQQFLGTTVEVLLEHSRHHYQEGLTDNYVRVELHDLPEQETDWQHRLVKAELSHLVADGVYGYYRG